MTSRSAFVRAVISALVALLIPLFAGPTAAQDSTGTGPAASRLAGVVDSVGLTRALAALQLPAPDAEPLFVLHFDSAGNLRLVEPPPSLPASYIGPVMDAIRRHARPRVPPHDPRAADSLIVRAGAAPEVGLLVRGPFGEEELPEMISRSEAARLLSGVSRRIAGMLGEGARFPYRTEVRFRVLTDGTPDDVYVRSSSGNPWVDELVVAVARRMRFRPARVGGKLVFTWVTLPVVIVQP